MRASAPSLIISSMNRNRDSNRFSVIIAVPSETVDSAIANGWLSVAKPGYGSVTKSTALGRPSMTTRKPSSVAALVDGDLGARHAQLLQHQVEVVRVHAAHSHVAARHDGGEPPRGADDPVADDAVLGRA